MMTHRLSVRRNEKVKPVNYAKVQEVTQEKDENPTVFLSLVTVAFRKDTSTDPESSEGRSLWPCILSPSSLLISGGNYKSLRWGPKPHCQPW